jgi:hypothetical protein
MTTIDKVISEDDFKAKIVGCAHDHGWLVFHPVRGNRDGRWYTAQQGDRGYPDLTLARGGRIVILELKKYGCYPTPDQYRWLTALSGVEWERDYVMAPDGSVIIGCVHPKDWHEIEQVLA